MTTRRPSQPRVRRRPTRSGQVLSPELIVDTALRMIELHGVEGLSMRRLGTALGAHATAAYGYFATKHELVLAMADELIGRTFARFAPTGEWQADLRTIAELIFRINLAHPQAAMLVTSRVTGRANEVAAVETILTILRNAGFDRRTAVRHYHCFISFVLSSAALESAMSIGNPKEIEAEQATWREVYGTLAPDRYPSIADSANELVDQLQDTPFYLTLDLLLMSMANSRPDATTQTPPNTQTTAHPDPTDQPPTSTREGQGTWPRPDEHGF